MSRIEHNEMRTIIDRSYYLSQDAVQRSEKSNHKTYWSYYFRDDAINWKIVIGGGGNKKDFLHYEKPTRQEQACPRNSLNPTEYRTFWLSWNQSSIRYVISPTEYRTFWLSWNQSSIRYVISPTEYRTFWLSWDQSSIRFVMSPTKYRTFWLSWDRSSIRYVMSPTKYRTFWLSWDRSSIR